MNVARKFMRYLFIMPFVWLGVVFSGYGSLPDVSVTPTNLDQQDYTFTISTNAAQGGTGFHIIITAKTRDIPADSSVYLWVKDEGAIFEDQGRFSGKVIGGRAAPPVDVTLKKNKRVWEADFMVPSYQLRGRGLCCMFAEGYDGVTGGLIDSKTVTFYDIHIQDLVSPKITFTEPPPLTRQDLIDRWKHDTKWTSWRPGGQVDWYLAHPSRVADLTPHYYYMGTGVKYGYDYVAQVFGSSHGDGNSGFTSMAVRGGELRIENRHAYSQSYSNWQEIDMSKQ